MDNSTCSICGQTIDDIYNSQLNFSHRFGYGSDYDGDWLKFVLCTECADKFLLVMRVLCRHEVLITQNAENPIHIDQGAAS